MNHILRGTLTCAHGVVSPCGGDSRALTASVSPISYYSNGYNINNRYLKEVDHFKYLGSVLTRDGYYTRENMSRIAIAKEAFNRQISLLTSKLNIGLKKKLVRCYVWSIVLYGSETWTLRKFERKYLESFEM